MFGLALDYQTGIYVHGAFIALALLVYIGYAVYCSVYDFVHDYNYSDRKKVWSPLGGRDSDGGDIAFSIFFAVMAGIVGASIWPIIWPITLTVVVALGLRKYYRFKRKIDKALSLKEDKS